MSLLAFLQRVMNREPLTFSDARQAMSIILTGQASTAQIASFLVALRMKGETAEELAGLAQAMRDSMVRVDPGPLSGPLIDTCGTGGDGQSTLNVSTLAAIVVAGAGVAVAKHGNRSISSRCGSADLLEALGVAIDLPAERVAASIREVGIGFLFAPRFHPAMRHAAAARGELKIRTAFNLLGPISNPAGATVQIVGAPTVEAAELLAVALSRLGLERGMVVHGAGGMDEISTSGPSDVFVILRGAIDHQSVKPQDFGVPCATLDAIRGGDVEENVRIARSVLAGDGSAYRDVVLVNAAAALVTASVAMDWGAGMECARRSIDSGAAQRKLQQWIEFSTASIS